MAALKTGVVERIYSVLEKYAEASPRYYDRELFIYNYGVVPTPLNKFRLRCLDSRRRVFHMKNDKFYLEGHGSEKVNSIVTKLIEESKKT